MNKMFLSLSLISLSLNAAPTEAEALAQIKGNISIYFNSTSGRCFEIQNVSTENTKVLNETAKEIIAFYNKAVALNYDAQTNEVLKPSKDSLEKLEAEGRALELKTTGTIGHYWFPVKSVYGSLNLEELAEVLSAFQCKQEIQRAMALVAPAVVKENTNGEFSEESYFTVTVNGQEEKRLRLNATKYAAIVVDNWFGEAGIEEIMIAKSDRAEIVEQFFKDVWQTGVVRALRYKKENSSYGLSWFEGNLARAQSDYKVATDLVLEDGSKPFLEGGHDKPSADFLKKAEELLQAGKDYLAAVSQ